MGKKGKQTQERTNQPPDITSVFVSEDRDNLGQEELTHIHSQVGRQTRSTSTSTCLQALNEEWDAVGV